MKNFITNHEAKNLKRRLIELIQKSEELKFLVGFFYFSGIRELYEGLKEKPDVNIKVLVGLNVDRTNFGLLEYADQDKQLSDEERCYKFLQSVKKSLNSEDFVLVLKTYLDSYEQKEVGQSLIKILEENGYKRYQYQLDAVKQALAIIEKNNGVIIADVVGLGKTIIACAVARELKKRGIVICPPGIVGDKNKNSGWMKYTEEFRLYDWEVRSLGDLENVSEFVSKAKDIEVVIVDEAHRFRNQDTKDYEYLKNICR